MIWQIAMVVLVEAVNLEILCQLHKHHLKQLIDILTLLTQMRNLTQEVNQATRNLQILTIKKALLSRQQHINSIVTLAR